MFHGSIRLANQSDPLAQQPFFATALMDSRIHYYRLN